MKTVTDIFWPVTGHLREWVFLLAALQRQIRVHVRRTIKSRQDEAAPPCFQTGVVVTRGTAARNSPAAPKVLSP